MEEKTVPILPEQSPESTQGPDARYEYVNLIVKQPVTGETWFGRIFDLLYENCDSVLLNTDEEGYGEWSECSCGVESMGGMSGTLDQCYNRVFTVGEGLQPIDLAQFVVSVVDETVRWNNPTTRKIIKWAKNIIEMEEEFNDEEGSNS